MNCGHDDRCPACGCCPACHSAAVTLCELDRLEGLEERATALLAKVQRLGGAKLSQRERTVRGVLSDIERQRDRLLGTSDLLLSCSWLFSRRAFLAP